MGSLGSGYVPAAPVLSGTFVTPESALGVAAVYCAVNVIATDIAILPRAVNRKIPGGGREPVDASDGYLSDLHDLISFQPNDDMDAMRWSQSEMNHVLTRGNGYNELVRRKGFITSIEPLHPSKTIPKRTEVPAGSSRKGVLYYELENKRNLAADDCLHFAGMGFNGIVGFSPVSVCRQTIGLTMGAEQYGASFFGNGAKTSGWIKMAKRLSEAAQNNWRKTFNQIHQGSQSAHQIGFLEEGMDWVNNSFSPEDSQFLGTREFQVTDVARIFRIPPHKIGDYSESHLASVEEANIDYVAMTLCGWVCMQEMAMNRKLLTREQRQKYEIVIDMNSLLRGNVTARMLKAQTMRNTGAWSADDIRLSEGQNRLAKGTGGDLYLVQSQYVPLDLVGKMPTQPAPAGKPTDRASQFPGLEEGVNGHAFHAAS
jgi:HK97 family phage portal protein